LRKKFRATETGPPIAMEIVSDAAPIVEEIYPLYLAVYERSALHFEKLTPDYFRRIGALIPDKVRFFLWRREGKIVAFTLCLLDGDALFAEYIGLDYALALELHLYHYAVRDMTSWAIANGYTCFRSSGLNYDPKLHLRHKLDPIDLYVRHTSPVANWFLKRALPLMEPTRNDPALRMFPNFHELWG
jgi:predicted N-acyltransferase